MRDVNDTTAELQGSVQQIKLIQAIGPVFFETRYHRRSSDNKEKRNYG